MFIDYLQQAIDVVTTGTTLVQKITLLISAIFGLGGTIAAWRGRRRKRPPGADDAPATTGATDEKPREKLERQVNFDQLVREEHRQARQASWSRAAGSWLLPIAVISATVFFAASVFNLVQAKTPFDLTYANVLAGLVLLVCYGLELLLTPERLATIDQRQIIEWALTVVVAVCSLYLAAFLIAPLLQSAGSWGLSQVIAIVGLLVATAWLIERRVVPSFRAKKARLRADDLRRARTRVAEQIDARLEDRDDAPPRADILSEVNAALKKARNAEKNMKL